MADGQGPSIFDRMNQGQLGLGGNKPGTNGLDGANDKTPFDGALDSIGQLMNNLTAMLGIPVKLKEMGSASSVQGLESEGIAGKNIPSMMSSINSNGGILAQIGQMLMKNGVITDHTGGISPADLGSFTPLSTGQGTGEHMEIG